MPIRFYDEKKYQRRFAKWLRKQGWKVTIEKTVALPSHPLSGGRRHGRIDVYAEKDGRVAIFELKAGSFVNNVTQAVKQLRTYRQAVPGAECYVGTPRDIEWRALVVLQAYDMRHCLIGDRMWLADGPPEVL